jgi:general secretion pathway protein D
MGIPFLSRIPLLGYLFETNTESVRKTELLTVVTPRLVTDPAESRSLYEELRRRAPELRRELEARTPPPAPPQSSAPEVPGAGPRPTVPDR